MAGIAKQTVYEMMKSATVDDLRSLRRARKARYYGTCEVCGGHTNNGGNAAPPSTICQECRTWPKDAIIEAIQRWADQHGGIPPTATEWRHSQDGHPCSTAVIKRIGWNQAILEAGFALHTDRRAETQQWIEDQARNGVSQAKIGAALGVSASNISQRLRRRGIVSDLYERHEAGWRLIEEQVRGGARIEDIARCLEMNPSSIYNRAKRRGVSIRELRREGPQ